MAQKAEIQYGSQFSGYGSDPAPVKKKKPFVFKKKEVKIHIFHIDPIAVLGIATAVVLCAAMIFGGFHLNRMWREHVQMKNYLAQLQEEHAALERKFVATFNMDEVKTMADSFGLVPETDMETRYIRVTPPEPKPKKGLFDDVKWFFKGLFAKDYPEGCIINPTPQ